MRRWTNRAFLFVTAYVVACMPFADYEDFEGCVRDNQDKGDPEAYCAEIKRSIEGAELSDAELEALENSDCPEGQAMVNGRCIPVTESDAPPSVLNGEARGLADYQGDLESQPIERDELAGEKVAYRNIRLIAAGTWTDQNSETPTLYDEETFKNTEPDYDSSQYDGPPVNIAHDLDREGEPHEASVGGHIDPESIRTDGEALFGDFILDRETDAGAFADTNLKSALESDGEVGFSPSVELMPEDMVRAASHQHAEEHVKSARLTGTGLVLNPASKTVDLAHESRNRAVALSASGGEEIKTLHRQTKDMSSDTIAEIRAEVLERNLQVGDIQDDAEAIADELDVPVDEVMEVLDPLLDMDEEEEEEGEPDGDGEGEPPEMEEDKDPEEDDEGEQEMQDDGQDAVDALQDQMASLSERLEELEDMMASQSELSEARQELADAESVEELEDAMDKRLSRLEEEPEDARTLADDSEDSGFEWSDADAGVEYDRATGSMSR